MKSFLQYVAADLIEKHGTDLSRVAVVFPNKRAALFLNGCLAEQISTPIWSPAYITISELFRQHSLRTVADPIKLVCDLHKSFVAQTGIDETLDHFYGWGQLLLADFDDLDKNMADADKVFANLKDIHELDDISYLSDEQKQVISRFFSNFSTEHNSELKERFLRLWSHLGDIYHDFNQRLSSQGLAYEGALYREVALNEDHNFRYDTYIFIGFNLLQRVEQRLFKLLKQQGKARFYWDFDHYYMKDHEAGHYIRQYLADFPNELDANDARIYDCFQQPKQVTYISAPTENIQARYITKWIDQQRVADGRQTAIVLCNEQLLQSVVHCLPSQVEKVNITTGFPLMQAPVASLVTQLINLQTLGYAPSRHRFRLHHVNALLRHPYISCLTTEADVLLNELNEKRIYYPSTEQLALDNGLRLLFQPIDVAHSRAELMQWLCDVVQTVAQHPLDDTANAPFFQESTFRAYTLLNRLKALIESGDLQVDMPTLARLINQLVQSASVPFHGEPAEGLQIMGVLETRNLDFRHILLLSCNEGNMPRGVNDTSFIPYNIRKAHGLTTIDHKVAIYSYYFHRLLQRADDVTILYNNATTDGQTGEMSRFMLQLMVEGPHKVHLQTLQAGQSFTPFHPQPIQKTPAIMAKLMQRFSTTDAPARTTDNGVPAPLLTPTAINRYLRCPLQFYYNYVCDLREPDVNDEDVIDNRIFGNIFHEASRIVYNKLMAQSPQITAPAIAALLKNGAEVERAVDEAFRKELFQVRDPHAAFKPELNGLQIINREVIIHYLRQLLEVDHRLAPFTILGLECDVVAPLQTRFLSTTIGGRIDRLDMVNAPEGAPLQRIRVIDYKTGSHEPAPLASVDAIFQQDSLPKHSDYYLQTFLYATIVRAQQRQQGRNIPVSPALLFIQHAGVEHYDPTLRFGREPITDVDAFAARYGEQLREVVDEMFNPDLAFEPTQERNRCQLCPYRMLCNVAEA